MFTENMPAEGKMALHQGTEGNWSNIECRNSLGIKITHGVETCDKSSIEVL